MPNIPIIGHRTEAVGPTQQAQASPDLGVARGLSQLGSGMSQAGARMDKAQAIARKKLEAIALRQRTREEVISRVQISNDYEQFGQEKWDEVLNTKDVARTDVVREYQQSLKDTMGEMLQSYTGSEEGLSKLAEKLEGIRSKRSSAAFAYKSKAQLEQINKHVTSAIGQFADAVGDNPEISNIEEQEHQLRVMLSDFADVSTDADEQAWVNSGLATITESAVVSSLDRNDPESASMFLERPGVSSYLPVEKMQTLRTRIASSLALKTKVEREDQMRLERAARGYGKPVSELSQEQRLAALDIPLPPKATISAEEKANEALALYAKLHKIPVAQIPIDVSSQIAMDIYGVDIKTGKAKANVFGTDAKANRMAALADFTDKLNSGTMTPEDDVNFDILLKEYLDPIPLRDIGTREPIVKIKALPDSLISAMQRRGMRVPRNGLNMLMTIGDQPEAPQTPSPTLGEVVDSPRYHLAQNADAVTGPIDIFGSWLAKKSLIFGPLATSTSAEAAKAEARAQQAQMINFLKGSPTYARQFKDDASRMAEVIDIGPRALGDEWGYEDRLVGAYDVVKSEMKLAEGILARQNSGDLSQRPSVEEIKSARSTVTRGRELLLHTQITRQNDIPRSPAEKVRWDQEHSVGSLLIMNNGDILKKTSDGAPGTYEFYRKQ